VVSADACLSPVGDARLERTIWRRCVVKIEDLMTKDVTAVGTETPLKDVAAILAERRISGLPVISEQRHVLGVVSEADVLAKERGHEARHGGLVAWLLGGGVVDDEKLAARTAGEAMTSPAITVGPHTHVSEAARLMTDEGIKRLPVVDSDGTLVGIVTRADLVRAFARPDAEIEREIREDVVRRTLWIEGENLELQVKRGVVTLSGELERATDVELLSRFVEGVPGVVSVESTVRARWDDRNAKLESNPRVPVPPRR
jgi:CBS domain-containing protein